MLPALSGIVGRNRTRDSGGGGSGAAAGSAGGNIGSASSPTRFNHPPISAPTQPHHFYHQGLGSEPPPPAPPPPIQGGLSGGADYDALQRDRERMRERENLRARERERAKTPSNQQQPATAAPAPAPAVSPAQSSSRYSSNHMESSVTRLLMATKLLLEALTKWSRGDTSETYVSDVYVRLGNDFNTARSAFGSYGIDMSDLISVPDDLRACLERCLSEDASPQILEQHLPRIREIIIQLLQGLKQKQAKYKQLVLHQRANQRGSVNGPPGTDVGGPSAQESSVGDARRSRRASRLGVSEAAPTMYEAQEALDTTNVDTRPEPPVRAASAGTSLSASSRATGARRPLAPPPVLPNSASPAISSASSSAPSIADGETSDAGGASTGTSLSRHTRTHSRGSGSLTRGGSAGSALTRPTSRSKAPGAPGASETSRFSTDSIASPSTDAPSRPSGHSSIAEDDGDGDSQAPFSVHNDGVQRHSLVDRPVRADSRPAPQVRVEPNTPSLEETELMPSTARLVPSSDPPSPLPSSTLSPVSVDADPSLRALKSRDALERRASKRFSAYTFNKMGIGQNFGMGMGMGMSSLGGLGNGGSPGIDRRSPSASSLSTIIGPRRTSSGNRREAQDVSLGLSRDAIEEDDGVGATSPGPSSRRPSNATRSPRLARANLSPGTPTNRPARKLSSSSVASATGSSDSLPFVDAGDAPEDEQLTPATPTGNGALGLTATGMHVQVPPVPPLPSGAAGGISPRRANFDLPTSPSTRADRTLLAAPHATEQGSFSIFLQLGRQTRKATLGISPSTADGGPGPVSIARLRILFMDRFSYSPGMTDFPTIYVKDVGSGVSYELEDLDDVREGTVLTLNIEPLDQVKQHLDLTLGAITREIRELKASVADRRASSKVSPEMLAALTTALANGGGSLIADTSSSQSIGGSSTAAAVSASQQPRITDSEFAAAGQRVAQLKRAGSIASSSDSSGAPLNIVPPGAFTGVSVVPDDSLAGLPSGERVASELKAQYEELSGLRREFAIMRQLQSDFRTDVDGLLGSLRDKAASVRRIAQTEAPAERNFIVHGKAKLDGASQEVLTLVEDLQDIVDDLKLDVTRGVKPKPAAMKAIAADITKATAGLEEIEKYVGSVKPGWKRTWEAELQNIVDEQEFLNHQEGLIADLRDDHANLQALFANIQQVVKLRSVPASRGGGGANGSGAGGRGYVPPPMEEGHEGLNTVLLEVRSQAVDHEKRLRALQAAERARAKEIASRSDDFADELQGFVDGKALRKTGGHMEAERMRAQRDRATIKAMFGGGGVGGAPTDTAPPPRKLILGRNGSVTSDRSDSGAGGVSASGSGSISGSIAEGAGSTNGIGSTGRGSLASSAGLNEVGEAARSGAD